MIDGWSVLRNFNRAFLNVLWTVRNFPETHVIVRGVIKPQYTANRLQNLISYLLVKNDIESEEAAETLLGNRGFGQMAYFAEQQLELGEPADRPLAGFDWSGFSWSDLDSGDQDRFWPGGLPGLYDPPFLYRVYDNGFLVVDASRGPWYPRDIVPAEMASGLPADLYRVHVDQEYLTDGGRIWTTHHPGDETFTLEDRLALFVFDPVSTPKVAATAEKPLPRGGDPAVLAVAASHWNGELLEVVVDASSLGGDAEMVLGDDGQGADPFPGDGIYSSEEFHPAAFPGLHSVPIRAIGSDGIGYYGDLEVEVVAGSKGE
jgi:hypothetical protein